ncbi:UDP-glucuronosyl/UDP-glucosyltransferase [Artemisia annua]|uniref:UDP-glucuronosyl/UDP-glucosyltransferase n=1 Tax=Artemisia annua TaxID=35608 RepID=A0A2U1M2Y0_ARTAN|nr:UDP-glucuronosyl/UDP-glucosyltransferase [Artemisia annua]
MRQSEFNNAFYGKFRVGYKIFITTCINNMGELEKMLEAEEAVLNEIEKLKRKREQIEKYMQLKEKEQIERERQLKETEVIEREKQLKETEVIKRERQLKETEVIERVTEKDNQTEDETVNEGNSSDASMVFMGSDTSSDQQIEDSSPRYDSDVDGTQQNEAVWDTEDNHIRPSSDTVILATAIELALGLELSKVPFIWFIKCTSEKLERWISEGGYEDRIKDRGLIVRGWAPQVLILSHQAIGGFITHCGWNSTLEAICAGILMVTWPHFADQFLNERFIIDVLKIGVRIGAEIPVSLGKNDNCEVMVKRENIKIAVECLMNNSEEGNARRKRAKELGEMAKKATEEGGSSHINMTSMIHDITQELGKNTNLVQDLP